MASGELLQLKQQLHDFLPMLKAKYPIEKMAFLGSVTRDDFDPAKSDIDIMVELNGNIGWGFIDLAEELEKLFSKKVDLITKGAIKPHYWPYIQKDLIYV